MVSSLPCALHCVQDCGYIPRVRGKSPFTRPSSNRLCSGVAAAHVLNGRSKSVVRRRHQRRRSRDDPFNQTGKEIFCERVVETNDLAQRIAHRKSRNLGFWLFFWSLLEQRPKVTRAGARNAPHAYIASTYRHAARPATAPSPTAVVSWRTAFTRPSPAANTPAQPVRVSSPA